MKKTLIKILSKNKLLKFYFTDNGYSSLLWGLFLTNIFFKNVLGINRKFKGMIHFTSRITQPERIIIYGENQKTVRFSFASSGSCYFQGINGIEIGGGSIFAYGVKVISSNHDPKNSKKHLKNDTVRIGKNVWIGANAIILPGVVIGDNSVIGAGAVVTKSFDKNSIIIGNPAEYLRRNE